MTQQTLETGGGWETCGSTGIRQTSNLPPTTTRDYDLGLVIISKLSVRNGVTGSASMAIGM